MTESLPEIYITTTDFERLSQLANHLKSNSADMLDEEISRATIVPKDELPFAVVTMNAVVKFRDLESNRESEVTLVYPESANIDEGKISILAPLGIALIGLSLHEIIEWPVPNGQSRKLQVVSIS